MKRTFSIIISTVIMTMLNVMNTNAAIHWDYNSTTHTLSISGTGAMADYDISENTPWYSRKDDITTVVVKSGVTSIGNNAFAKFPKLAFISLPNGLQSIGDYAFAETAVQQLVIPASVQTIGGAAFLWCDQLRTIYLGGSITRMGHPGSTDSDYGAFAYCDAVSDIYFYQNNISSISWNNTWEFKDNKATKVHVYKSASLPSGLNCNFVKDIGDDMRSVGQSDMTDPDNPYEIYYKWQLDFIIAMINSTSLDNTEESNFYLKLMADLAYDETEENNFTPVGSEEKSFFGSLDGNGHTISGINIKTDKDYVGIIPYVTGTVKNIKFDNIHIQTTGSYAGVMGGANFSTIDNICIENSSFQADNCVGPLLGILEDAVTVRNCHVKSSVTVKGLSEESIYSNAGGLIGKANGGSLSGCSSAAQVSGNGQCVAGLVGYNKADLTDCIYLGASIIGSNAYAVSDNYLANVSNCFYTEPTLTDGEAQQAYTLTMDEGVTLTNTVVSTYGTSDFPGITSYNDILFFDGNYYAKQTASLTFANQDAWYVVNDECVRTNSIQMPGQETHVSLYALDGTGTEEAPYLINNTNDMDYLASRVNSGNSYEGKYVELTASLVYDGTENNYTPVGKHDNPFDGVFDGKGHSISGIYVRKSGSTYSSSNGYNGIFGVVGSNGIVKNLVSDSNTFTGHYTGGIVGYNLGIIENCRATSTVILKAAWSEYYNTYKQWNGTNYIGGIVGYQPSTTVNTDAPRIIRGCVSAAYIDNDGHHACKEFGGIIGSNNRSTPNIQHCLYLGDHVSVGTDLGGSAEGAIAGWTFVTTGYTPNSYYTDNSLVGDYNNNFLLAHKIILAEDVEIDDEKTVYGEGDYIGVTAYDNGVLFYDGVYYAPQNLEVTLKLAETSAEGVQPLGLMILPYSFGDTGDATSDGMTLTMGSADIYVAIASRIAIANDNWIYYRSETFSDISETDKLLVLHSEEELARVAYEVNVLGNNFEGWTVKLADDKDFYMPGHRWEPVGSIAMLDINKLFKGTFDGNRRNIRGINASLNDSPDEYSNDYIGLFSILPEGAVVKDLFIQEATVTGARNAGVVAGENRGTVTNCHIVEASVSAVADNAEYVGGVTGNNLGGTIQNSSVSKTAISDGDGCQNVSHFGGICGGNTTYAQSLINMETGDVTTNVREATMSDNIFFGSIHVSGADPLGHFGSITGDNRAATDRDGNEYPAHASNNYYDNAPVVVDNDVPSTYWGDDTHPYDTSLGVGIGQTSPNGNLGYSSTDVEGVAEPLAVDGRDNTDALNLLITRNQYFDRPENSLIYHARHTFTLKGRTFYKDKGWNTICLPFDMAMTYSSPFGQADAMELTGSSFNLATKTLTLDFADPEGWEVKAGKPYIVRWWDKGENTVDPVFEDVTVLTAELIDEATDYITFKGTYAPVVYEEGRQNRSILLMGADNKLYYPNGEAVSFANAFRGYFQLADELHAGDKTSMVSAFVLNFNGGETGNEEIQNLKPQTSNLKPLWFTLDGRRINGLPNRPGVYINNGKKVAIK